jgi:uncharacterized Fe-S cluster protein YjdI
MKKEYTNGEIIIIWNPSKCLHAAQCISRLPEVFQATERPWIKAENADSAAIIETIEHCPSGALSYRWKE